jgi:predicted nucleotidyltransferase
VLIRNTCSLSKIDPRHTPLIQAAVETYQALFEADLLSVRLLGSVARGEAVPGESDIDLLALVRRDPQPAELDHLARREAGLSHGHPLVARVDLEAEWQDKLSEFRRLVISSDSTSVFGSDQLTRPRQYMARAELARLVTPDTDQLIPAYRAAIEALDASDRDLIARYARVVGKDLLRGLRQAAILRGGAYEKNIGAIYAQVVALVPEHRSLADALYALYRGPHADKEVVLRVLNEASDSLVLMPG